MLLKYCPRYACPRVYTYIQAVTATLRYPCDMIIKASSAADWGKQIISLAVRCSVEITEKEFYTFKWLQDAPLEPLCQNPSTLPDKGNTPNDDFGGMASVPFPFLRPKIAAVENGLWCRGCERTFERYRFQQLASDAVSGSIPPGCDPLRVLLAMQRRARSKARFPEHITHCYDAQELVLELGARIEID